MERRFQVSILKFDKSGIVVSNNPNRFYFQETIEAVLSPPNKKTKVSVDEKRQALMAVEKQRTLRVQRQLAEEQLQLVRKQTKLADDQIQFYKVGIWRLKKSI